MVNREHELLKYGPMIDEAQRWRRVVEQLDKYYPEWRKGAGYAEDPVAFIGDAAVLAIGELARRPLRTSDAGTQGVQVESAKKEPIGYITRRTDTTNITVDFETAKRRALKCAGMNPRGSFAVYAVTEVGRAEITAPPVEWRYTSG